LDVGCGDGFLTGKLLAMRPDLTVVAVDQNPYAVERARGRASQLEARVADGEFLPYRAGEFDVVVCTYTLGQTIRPHVVLFEMARVLKPGGRLVLAVPSRHPIPWSANPLSWLEVLVGSYLHWVLSPHHNLVNWVSDHRLDRHYTIPGLVRQLGHYLLKPVRVLSMDFALTRMLVRALSSPAFAIRLEEGLLQRIPVLSRLGWSILVVAEKPQQRGGQPANG
jgi:SAM-dependent methyltransferase